MKVLGLSGSLRSDSHNTKLLRAAGSLLPPEAELLEFGGLKAIPPYDPDEEGARPFAGHVGLLSTAETAPSDGITAVEKDSVLVSMRSTLPSGAMNTMSSGISVFFIHMAAG